MLLDNHGVLLKRKQVITLFVDFVICVEFGFQMLGRGGRLLLGGNGNGQGAYGDGEQWFHAIDTTLDAISFSKNRLDYCCCFFCLLPF